MQLKSDVKQMTNQLKIKGKVVPLLKLINHYAMNMNVGLDVYIRVFLTLALVGGEWSASYSDRFTSRERAPGTHCT
jgi:hypothetical protein